MSKTCFVSRGGFEDRTKIFLGFCDRKIRKVYCSCKERNSSHLRFSKSWPFWTPMEVIPILAKIVRMNPNETPKSDYQTFREEKHKSFNTPQEIINGAIEKAAKSPIVEQERIIAGETNEVHLVRTENGREVIIRIYHGEKPKFERERWAIEQCREVGVPVPEVMLVESTEAERKPLHICVESKLEGVPMGDIRKSDDPEISKNLKALLGQLGNNLGKIHSVPVNGFGSLDKNGNGKYRTAKELLTQDLTIAKENTLPEHSLLTIDREIVFRAKEILNREAENFPLVSPRLLHGDLAPQHVLVKEGKISGIIDFEHAKGSDPAEEFARWELKFGDTYPIADIQEGYGNKELFGGDFKKRKNVWRLYQGLAILSYCVREKKQFGIDNALKGLAETVQLFN